MKEMPITVKRSLELMGIAVLGFIIVYGQSILTPIITAFFVSILLLPVYRMFKKISFPNTVAILCAILIAAIVVASVFWFFGMQISNLLSDITTIQKNLTLHWEKLSSWINQKTHFSTSQQLSWLEQRGQSLLGDVGKYLSGAALTLSSIFVFVGLLPLYIFLMLFYKNLLLRFVFLWFKEADHQTVTTALYETESIIKSYLLGLMIQITYITILLGGILMIIGIKHALLIGVIFAILNLIPYVGALVGNIIGVLLTLTSSQELWQIFVVLGVIGFVQFLDNNILMPRIVGGKVKLNALASIVGVIIGGTLAGVAGMFLSLPIMAVLKIVFDKTDGMKQWGVLLGEDNPKLSPLSHPAVRLKSRRVREEEENDNKNK